MKTSNSGNKDSEREEKGKKDKLKNKYTTNIHIKR